MTNGRWHVGLSCKRLSEANARDAIIRRGKLRVKPPVKRARLCQYDDNAAVVGNIASA
jgi:hypothetical protein